MGDFSNMLMNGAAGAVTGGISSLVDFGLGQITGAQQYKRTKKLMKQQHQFELENMATQDKYQRSLMQDADILNKKALQKAGYSTADPNGTGFEAPTMSMPGTSASGSVALSPTGNTAASYSALMSGELNASSARLNDIEAQYRAKLLEGKIGLFKEQIEQIKQQLPEQVSLLKEQVHAKQTEWKLNEKSVERLDADIDRLGALTKSINIDNEYKADLNDRQIKKYDREIHNLLQDGKVKEVEARLASLGILVNADWLTTIAAIAASGTSGELTEKMMSMLQSLLSQIPDAAGKILPSVADSVVQSAKRIASKVAHGLGIDR